MVRADGALGDASEPRRVILDALRRMALNARRRAIPRPAESVIQE
jgi:hypothetical protein